MVEEQLVRRGITSPRVLDALRKVQRHRFVPQRYASLAYEDRPLPIGSQQTISQPYMVALMTQLLDLEVEDRVLEIGVGSGYQTAILAELVAEVIGIERLPELAASARQRLAEMGYNNVQIHIGDGSLGYPASAPYDAILVAAASPRIPDTLLDQLVDGGRLVIPVRFVPLIGEEGFG
jgi:protein-L-isoaspartate(D-aspartate) O-methyltransferase